MTITERDSWQNSFQRRYPWACGSCVYSGAPGWCSSPANGCTTAAVRCKRPCISYIQRNETCHALEDLRARGLETGDAFTINMQSW
jgi:hypothetical protein